MDKIDLLTLLPLIHPAALDYQEWVNVGMALKHEGYTAADWDQWSQRDLDRYHPGECFKKWGSFQGTADPVTAGTIVKMAQDAGWRPESRALGWNDVIGERDELVVVDKNWIENREVPEPEKWKPADELIRYLSTLFQSTEMVSYVTESWQNKDGRYMPSKGVSSRTAGELMEALGKCQGDIGAALGDYNPEVGAWIRFNPVDGKGITNDNVTEYRYALVESDDMPIDKQNAILRELELPIAALVHSGKKSLHAIVKVDAPNYEEYRKRVDYLYKVCAKNGLIIDTQNRNPSRLSRMPGVMRQGHKQFLVDTHVGKGSWSEWYEWIESVNDDLPEPEGLAEVWDSLPDLSPPLIDGILRQGHKMLLAGPSKAGKSFSLINLGISIAEGASWFGWPCTQGRILYVNLELDRASCLHRFRDVYQALKLPPKNISNIDIWNLRGKSVPMDKLGPKLIRRASKRGLTAVIIDPIYKVITGDENSAEQMAHFCNQFDRICNELGVAVIYCHHHSKGYQGQKRSMDRASGSGVFARDPDVLLDMTELDITDDIKKKEADRAECAAIVRMMEQYAPDDLSINVKDEDYQKVDVMRGHARKGLNDAQMSLLGAAIREARDKANSRSAWRMDGTLREFPKFDPIDIWFDYPIHTVDRERILEDMLPPEDKPGWKKAIEKRKPAEEKREERHNELEIAFTRLEMDGSSEPITTTELCEELGVTLRTLWNRIKEHGGFDTEKQGVGQPSIIRRKK